MNRFATVLTGSLLAGATLFGATKTPEPRPLEEQVRRELVTLPFYNVFDNLTYSVVGDEVILSGQVTRPTLRSSAENVVKRLAGVAKVSNHIEVLPLSPFDNRLRLALYRSIYSQPGLDRYALGAIPGIHIIVKNGNVTLEGVVNNEMERNLAFLKANGVSGVFQVENNLRVAGAGK
ncbi:MAG: BON domain-containing protein [Bryobacteraceae bacterium]|nr:BON domain-containing protein [Bryobacteraceae bacterium]